MPTIPKQIPLVKVLVENSTPLTNGQSFETDVLDLESFPYLIGEFEADVSGVISATWYADEAGTISLRTFSIPYNSESDLSFLAITRLSSYIQFTFLNNSGSNQSQFHFVLRAETKQPTGSLQRIDSFVPQNSIAPIVRSIVTGFDSDGNPINAGVNKFGALQVNQFILDAARGVYPGANVGNKFGRVPEISISSAPTDIWQGGTVGSVGLYSGFNAVQNENLQTLSASTNDVGSLEASGTATGGDSSVLVDSGATFVTDGILAGDLIINDTQGFHGTVKSVDSETQLTTFGFSDDDPVGVFEFASGDSL
jgi:hypothetical protein